MKPSEDQIKQAILHPDQIVRGAALQYFTLSFSRDRSIMPVAIQAIEKYGWEEVFGHFWMIQELPQTDETLLWLVGQLDGPSRLPESIANRICSVISHADTELLGRHQSRLEQCRCLDERWRKVVREKIELLSVPGETCWTELESLCQRHKDDTDSEGFEFDRAKRLAEAISRAGDQHADQILSILSAKIENRQGNPQVWLDIFMAMVAGLIRLESAAPLLVAKLKDDDSDFMNEESTNALVKIGSDTAVEAIAKDFHSAPTHFRLYASSALQDMRGDKVVATALELLKGKEDGDTQAKFIGTALANFDAEGLRVARDFGVDNLPELRRGLIATAILTAESFPDLERLREQEREHQAEIRRRQEWLFGVGLKAALPSVEEPVAEPIVQPIKLGRKIGRNEPCPCGSGKKYKHCCLNKDKGR